MLKKWFADYKNKLRTEGMKNCNSLLYFSEHAYQWNYNIVENMKCRPALFIDIYIAKIGTL